MASELKVATFRNFKFLIKTQTMAHRIRPVPATSRTSNQVVWVSKLETFNSVVSTASINKTVLFTKHCPRLVPVDDQGRP